MTQLSRAYTAATRATRRWSSSQMWIGGSVSIYDPSISAVEQRLAAGSGALVRGDLGSGKSTVLAEIGERAAGIGRPVLRLCATAASHEIPFGLFHAAAGFPSAPDTRVTPATTSAWLSARRLGDRGLLLVDDIDLADAASLMVIEAMLRETSMGLACSWSSSSHDVDPVVTRFVRELHPVDLPPLGFGDTSALLAAHSHAEVDAGLTRAIASLAAGIPRIVVAIFDAGVWSQSFVLEDDVWSGARPLEDVPLVSVAHAYAALLSETEHLALSTLAWCGAIPWESAQRIVGTATARSLMAKRRLVIDPRDATSTVVVTPPALGRALLHSMSPAARWDAANTVEQSLGDTQPEAVGATKAARRVMRRYNDVLGGGPFPESITVLSERLRLRTATLWHAWEEHRTLSTAVPVLRLLMLHDAESTDPSTVFRETTLTVEDADEDVARYLVMRQQWMMWTGREDTTDFVDPPPGWDPGEWATSMAFARDRLLVPLLRNDPIDAIVENAADPIPPGLAESVHALRAQALLEQGRLDQLLEVLELPPADSGDVGVRDRLDALRGDGLLAAGDIRAAQRWFRRGMADAQDRVDPFGVRVCARGLATAAFVEGDEDACWQAMSLGLGLGRPGPLTVGMDDRLIALGVAVAARRGDERLALGLQRELDSLQRAVSPPLDVMREWAAAEILYAQDPDSTEAGDILWRAGERQRERGAPAAALLAWMLIGTALGTERLGAAESVWAVTPVPLLAPVLAVQRQLEHGTADQILRAAARLPGRFPLATHAFRRATDRWPAEQGTALTEQIVAEMIGDPRPELWRVATGTAQPGPGPLTDREREVLELARSGRSNREIADALFLSVRTVENHLYRARQKTGGDRAGPRY